MKKMSRFSGYQYNHTDWQDSLLDSDKTFARLGWKPQFYYGDHVEFYVEKGRDLRAQFWTSLLRRGIQWLKKVEIWTITAFVAFRRARENRRAIRQLMTISDYGLKDMGITRGEVTAMVTGVIQKCGRGE